jgi:hydrogenase nickel incorporation protein HypA/HybF
VHELSLAQNIAEIAQNAADANGTGRIVTVFVRIGELSGVVIDSLTFCFSAITAGTPLEGAALHVDRIPVRARCRACGTGCEIRDFVFRCPSCGGGDMEILTGRELHVSHIEVEEESPEQQ